MGNQTSQPFEQDQQRTQKDAPIQQVERSSSADPRPVQQENDTFFFTRHLKDCRLEVLFSTSSQPATLRLVCPQQTVLVRKQCVRVLGVVLRKIANTKKPTNSVLARLTMHKPVQLNVLIALAALGVYLKPVAALDKEELVFELHEDWPIAIDSPNSIGWVDATALQFRTVWHPVRQIFVASEYCTQKNTFVWRAKQCYRYRQYAYFKKRNLLMFEKASEVVERLRRLDFDEKKQTLYLEYQHIQTPVSFMGTVQDFLRKHELLQSKSESQGFQALNNAKVHTFVLVRKELAEQAAKMLRLVDQPSNIEKRLSVPHITASDILRCPELLIRNTVTMFTNQRLVAATRSVQKSAIDYDPHNIVGNAVGQRRMARRVLAHLQNQLEEVAGIANVARQ
jgi:hypothetical protein